MGKPAVITGIKKIYVAQMTADDPIGGIAYNAPVQLNLVQEIGLKIKINPAILYAENNVADINVAFQEADIDIVLANLTSAQQALLFGQTTAASGGVYSQITDQPPYFALLYKATLPGGYFRYGCFYKGMFLPPDIDMKTQEGKINYAPPKTTGTFIATQYNGLWEWHLDTSDPNGSSMTDATWFASVTFPTGDITAPTISSTTPASNATNVAIGTTYHWHARHFR